MYSMLLYCTALHYTEYFVTPQPELCQLNLCQSAKKIHDFIRGLDSKPGAWISLEGQVRIHRPVVVIQKIVWYFLNSTYIFSRKPSCLDLNCGLVHKFPTVLVKLKQLERRVTAEEED